MCIYMYVCVCIYMCMCVYVYICVCVCIEINMYVCVYIYVCVCVYIYIYVCVCVYIYIYIFVCVYVYFGSISLLIPISLNIRHFLSTYFFLDPFVLPYCFYRIQRELIYVLSIVVCIPSTFCPTLDHHQGRIYYKRDVTFVFAYYYYVRASLPLKSIAFAFKWVSINSVSS